ncbi:hypothetical protein LINPERPRIM_LOCUS21002 [Linum perenne]
MFYTEWAVSVFCFVLFSNELLYNFNKHCFSNYSRCALLSIEQITVWMLYTIFMGRIGQRI